MTLPVHPYKPGQRVHSQVEKIYPYGVFVRLSDGTRAYIRRRELSLAGALPPHSVVQNGQQIEAIVSVLPQPGRMMELSHRATLPDPWETFIRTYRAGDVVEGSVKDVRTFGIFVEIVPGIDGLVSAAELAAWNVQHPADLFWVGDQIEAVIANIDRRNRKVGLSIKHRRDQLAQVAEIMERLRQRSADAATSEEEVTQLAMGLELGVTQLTSSPTVDPSCGESVGRILIVEDAREIGEPLVAWLCNRGYAANVAHTPSDAQDMLRERQYGLLLVDIDLPEMDGLALIRQIRMEIGAACVAFMSAPEKLEEYASEIQAVGAVEVFAKPLDLDEIEGLLARIGQGDGLAVWRASAAVSPPSMARPFCEFVAPLMTGGSLADRLQASLDLLVKSTGAETGAIFHKDPISKLFSIPVRAGCASLAEGAVHALKESPVNDVLHRGSYLHEGQVSLQAEARFRKLLDLVAFESCIGVPLETGSDSQYALFLFHHQVNAFHRYHVRDAIATAALCAALVERAALNQRLQRLNQLLLTGQLAASFGHEVFNKVSGLEIQLCNLQTGCDNLAHHASGMAGHSGFAPMKQDVDSLVHTARDLRLMVEHFQRLMRVEDEVPLDVCATVRHVIAQVRPVAGKHGVKIRAAFAAEPLCAAGGEVRLQQALFNLMLNAIQHMATHGPSERRLAVMVAHETSHRGRPIQIRIIDSGPGIHKELWERIFDLGFTTRAGGSGLGLFIARSLVESMGGAVSVERSVVPLGSTFLLELPVAAA